MLNFNFYSPTEFVFGRGTEEQTGKLCKEYGAQRVLIVYGGGSAVRSGLLARVEASLDAEGISHCSLGGVRPNPTDPKVYEGLELARKEQVDFLLAVGGGSVIDTAKAIAAGIFYDGDFWDLYIGKGRCTKALPVGVVLTIPAAGSEGSGNTVITKESTQQKLGLREPKLLRPRFAVMNPELTLTLPEWQTASGICDMMIHILERYLTNTTDVEMTDRICEGLLTGIMRSAERLMSNPQSYEERANIMWAGTVAHNGICGVGREEDWTSHAIEHEISAIYDVTHGAGLAVVTPAFMEYALQENPLKIAQFAVRVMGVAASTSDVRALSFDEQKAVAYEGIRSLRTWFHNVLRLPVTMRELGIENPDIDRMVDGLHRNKGEITGFYVKLDRVASRKIYEMTVSEASNNKNIIKSMNPSNSIICHARYEVVRDEHGEIIDSICTEANKRFCEFYHHISPVGKKRSELLYASNPLVCRVMAVVLGTGESQVFCYEETGLGIVDVIIEDVGDGKSCDVYTIDVMSIKEIHAKEKVNLRKYAIASQLYGLAVWQWDIKAHKIYADNMLTDSTGNENVDMDRAQLVWDEFDRLDYIYEEDQHVLMDNLYAIRDGLYTNRHFYFRIKRNGIIRTVEARAIVDSFDQDGKPLVVIAVSRLVDGHE